MKQDAREKAVELLTRALEVNPEDSQAAVAPVPRVAGRLGASSESEQYARLGLKRAEDRASPLSGELAAGPARRGRAGTAWRSQGSAARG